MDDAVAQSLCSVSIVGETDMQSSVQGPIEAKSKISGANCPVIFSSSMKATTHQSGMIVTNSFSVVENFSLNQDGFNPLNLDVSSYNMKLQGNVRFAAANETSFTVGVNVSANLQLQSQTSGAVNIQFVQTGTLAMNMNQQAQQMTMQGNNTTTVIQSFPDFKVVGYMTSQMNVKMSGMNMADPNNSSVIMKYYINGKEVSEEEFRQVFGNFEMLTE